MNSLIKFLYLNALLIGSASLAMDHGAVALGRDALAININAVALGNDAIAINNLGQGDKLLRAARDGNLLEVKALLAAGVPANAKNYTSVWTPLNIAACNGHEEICKLLIDALLAPIKQMKQNQEAAIALLSIKKFRRARCMDPIDPQVIKLIARQIYRPVSIAQETQKLFDQIDAITDRQDELKEKLADYARTQLNPKKQNSLCIIA